MTGAIAERSGDMNLRGHESVTKQILAVKSGGVCGLRTWFPVGCLNQPQMVSTPVGNLNNTRVTRKKERERVAHTFLSD